MSGSTDESEAIRRLRQMADLVTPMSVRVAATLRLPDHVADGVSTVDALAERTGTDSSALGRLLRHLVALGIFGREGERFVLTDLSQAMREGHGGNMGPRALDVRSAVGRIDLAAVALLDAVRSGGPAYPIVHGRGFWDDLASDPALGAGFDAYMGSGDLSSFGAGYDWSAVRHVVDVGGGIASVLIALLRERPHLRGTLVELPGTAVRAEAAIAGAGLADRIEVVAQSFFEPLPAGADVYLLAAIVHDWPDARAADILRRCAEAAGPSGRVLVSEQVLDPAGDQASMTGFDLFMLICCGGRERTLDEFRMLGGEAGLTLRAVLPGPLLEFVTS
jgi:hypothetical protein